MSHQVRIDFDGKQAFLEAEFPAAVGDIIEIEYEDIEGLFRVKERAHWPGPLLEVSRICGRVRSSGARSNQPEKRCITDLSSLDVGKT